MSDADEAQWRAALGRNAEHYLKHFRKIAATGRRWIPGWNSAAFLHSTAWFCYRRMYGWAFLNLLAPWILLFILIAFTRGPDADTIAFAALAAYLAAVFVVLPLLADSFYYRQLAPRLARARPPSVWTALGAAASVLVYFVLLLATVMPTYGDYAPRAKVSEAVLAASAMRTEVTEFYQGEGRLPDAAEARKLSGEPQSARVRSIVWDPAQRAIVVTMRDPFPGKRFALRAIEEKDGLAWKCATIDLDKKHLPLACRD